MQRVLVTGATGMLGQVLVGELATAGYAVRAMSHRQRPSQKHAATEWVQADIGSGAGLAAAVAGIDTIVHAASQPFGQTWQVDVVGTERLLVAARASDVHHLVYISIVGVDAIPLRYYRCKLAAEARVVQGAVPWSIQRTTQFHPFVDRFLCGAARWPLLLLPTSASVQPLGIDEAAARLRELVAAGPQGRVADMGGPEVLPLGEVAREWRQARGVRKALLPLPLPGALGRALRRGALTCPEHRDGSVRWGEWLDRQVLAHTEERRKEKHQ